MRCPMCRCRKKTLDTSHPKTMNPTLEELEAREREAWAVFNAADAVAKPLREAWVASLQAVQTKRIRDTILAELRITYRGEERLPE